MQITITAVFIKDRKILLEKRRKDEDNYADCWALPGGHVEKGENPEDALVREMKEELAIIVRDFEFLETFEDIDPTSKEEFEHNAFLCRTWLDHIATTTEQERLKWFNLDEFEQISNHRKVDENIVKEARKRI